MNLQLDRTDEYWLNVAKAAGFSKSWVVRSLLQPCQHCGVEGEVRAMIERRIQELRAAGRVTRSYELEAFLEGAIRDSAYLGYPEGYR
jgi:hypothetical protein